MEAWVGRVGTYGGTCCADPKKEWTENRSTAGIYSGFPGAVVIVQKWAGDLIHAWSSSLDK